MSARKGGERRTFSPFTFFWTHSAHPASRVPTYAYAALCPRTGAELASTSTRPTSCAKGGLSQHSQHTAPRHVWLPTCGWECRWRPGGGGSSPYGLGARVEHLEVVREHVWVARPVSDRASLS